MTTIKITKREAITRINRQLRHSKERLYTTPDWRGFPPEGDHYIVNVVQGRCFGRIVQTHVDVARFARDLGVLGVREVVEE